MCIMYRLVKLCVGNSMIRRNILQFEWCLGKGTVPGPPLPVGGGSDTAVVVKSVVFHLRSDSM